MAPPASLSPGFTWSFLTYNIRLSLPSKWGGLGGGGAGTQVLMFTTHRKLRDGSIVGWEYSCCNTSLLSRKILHYNCINMNKVR